MSQASTPTSRIAKPQASGFGTSAGKAWFGSPAIPMAKTNNTVTNPAPTLSSMTATSAAQQGQHDGQQRTGPGKPHRAEQQMRHARH